VYSVRRERGAVRTGSDLQTRIFESFAKREVTFLKNTAIGRTAIGKTKDLYQMFSIHQIQCTYKILVGDPKRMIPHERYLHNWDNIIKNYILWKKWNNAEMSEKFKKTSVRNDRHFSGFEHGTARRRIITELVQTNLHKATFSWVQLQWWSGLFIPYISQRLTAHHVCDACWLAL
jgi:hypothetical protein